MFVFVLFFCWLYVCVRVSKVDSWLALPILCMCVLCGVHLLSRCDYTSMCVPLLLLVVFVFHSLYNYCCFPLTSRQPQCRFLLFSVLFSKTTVKLSIIISGIQLYFLLSPPLSMPSNQNHCFFFCFLQYDSLQKHAHRRPPLSPFRLAFRALRQHDAVCPVPLWSCPPAHGCPPW